MHIPPSIPSSTVFLLAVLSESTSAVLTARVQTHFYSACPSSIPPSSSISVSSSSPKTVLNSSDLASPPAPPAYRLLPDGYNTDLLAQQLDIHPGVCQNVFAPSFHRDQVDHVSVEAILTQLGEPFQQCNITVHEVPGCVDPALLTAPFMDGSAVSSCVQRNFAAYSQVWVQLNCGEVGTGTAVPPKQRPSSFNATTITTPVTELNLKPNPKTADTQVGTGATTSSIVKPSPDAAPPSTLPPQLRSHDGFSGMSGQQQQQQQQQQQPTTLLTARIGNDKGYSPVIARTITTTTTTVRIAAGTGAPAGCGGNAVRKRIYLRRREID